MKHTPAYILARTAVLLALVVGVQQLKTVSQFITGPVVNAILIIAVLSSGLFSGLAISVLSPVFALLINPMPIMTIVPQMAVAIMLGHAVLALAVYVLKDTSLVIGLGVGALAKAGVLWAGVAYAVVPLFGQALSDNQRVMLTAMFSYNQLITAAAGGAIAYLAWLKLRKIIARR